MKLARALLLGHATALVFGLAGMLIALPHPELWSASPLGQQAFTFGMQYAGPLHMVLGAAAMLAFGGAVLGWRCTLLFFGLACGLSLASELIGTGTGYPFGNYEYTSGLGYKILGRVPFSIPLSWFYMGLASLLLGGALARWHPVWSVVLGAYFLTAWDLVLDPAMAHPSLALNFWIWHQSGPYFGMPVQNFLGWTATGALFTASTSRTGLPAPFCVTCSVSCIGVFPPRNSTRHPPRLSTIPKMSRAMSCSSSGGQASSALGPLPFPHPRARPASRPRIT